MIAYNLIMFLDSKDGFWAAIAAANATDAVCTWTTLPSACFASTVWISVRFSLYETEGALGDDIVWFY